MFKKNVQSLLLLSATTFVSAVVVGQEAPIPTDAQPVENKSPSTGTTSRKQPSTFAMTKVVQIIHIKPNWAVSSIERLFSKQKDKFSLVADNDLSAIFIRGDEQLIEEIAKVIHQMDVPEPPKPKKGNDLTREQEMGTVELDLIAPIDTTSSEGRLQLSSAIRKEFEQKQNQLRLSLLELSERIKLAQELLTRREQLADEICKRRFDDIVAVHASKERLATDPKPTKLAEKKPMSPAIAIESDTIRNTKWSKGLGVKAVGGIAAGNGKVYAEVKYDVFSSSNFPASHESNAMCCFQGDTGDVLWKHNSNISTATGVRSTPYVDGDRLWYVSRNGQVICLDTEGFSDGENDGPFKGEAKAEKAEADVVWIFDMNENFHTNLQQPRFGSVTCAGDLVFVSTSQGTDPSNDDIANRKIPCFICLERSTGKVVWKDDSPGPNQINGGWSTPIYSVIDNVPQVIFGGADGFAYGFLAEGENGKPKLLWKFDCNPKEEIAKLDGGVKQGTRCGIVASPVIYHDRVYIATGDSPDKGEGPGILWCIDPTKRGDISPTLVYNDQSQLNPIPHKRLQALERNQGDYEKPNPNSGEVWRYTGAGMQSLHRTIGKVAIEKDLLIITDISGFVHCLDATTGKLHWTHDLLAACWCAPLIVDGKVYVGDEDGDIAIFQLSSTLKVAEESNLKTSIYGTPVFDHGLFFIPSGAKLFAIKEDTIK